MQAQKYHLKQAYLNGAIFDSWTEMFRPEVYDVAIKVAGVNVQNYLDKREVNEALAWDLIDAGINKEFLSRASQNEDYGKF